MSYIINGCAFTQHILDPDIKAVRWVSSWRVMTIDWCLRSSVNRIYILMQVHLSGTIEKLTAMTLLITLVYELYLLRIH